MNALNEVGPHGLRVGPRQYRIRFASPGGGTSQMNMDGYSPEDAIRRLRKSGVGIPAALIHSVKCIGQRIERSAPLPTEGAERIYNAARNVEWDDPTDVARFEAQVKAFKERVDNGN